MNIEQAQRQFDSERSRLEDIKAELTKKQAEYDSAKQAHAKHVASTTGRKRYPRSLNVQREALLRLKMEIEGLEGAKAIAEEKLADVQTTLHLVQIHEIFAKPYQQAEQVYFNRTQKVIAAVDDLNERTAAVCVLVDKFLEQSGNPVGMLKVLINDPALSNLSLKKFIDGEIAEATAGENDRFLDDLATKYAEIARRLPEVETAQDSLETLSDHFDSMNREANALVPRHVKYIPQAAPSKPESQVQRGQLLPRHARGGPEVDDKEDPRSPYWVRRRAALRPEINANTPVGKA
jgi:hypothetical protein